MRGVTIEGMGAVRRIAVLGSTGSIGRQALDVARAHPERFEVVALVAHSDREGLAHQAEELGVSDLGFGVEGAVEAAMREDVDVVLNAVVGAAGLRATLAALASGKVLALANKESMVAAGELCRRTALEGGGVIVPVDSEHAALAQCLEGRARETIGAVVLTASGGPFRSRNDLAGVTPEEALAHPTWRMGPKITIDCATLMNKGLEVIEAHYLFGFSYDAIRVLVHPQSVVHAMVELVDGSVIMQAAAPDMRLPIQAALSAPDRLPSIASPLDLSTPLQFEPLDPGRWPAVGLAYSAGRAGKTFPAVLNAANEEAVRAFLGGAVSFLDITRITEEVLAEHDPTEADEIDSVLDADAWARDRARRVIDSAASVSARSL